MKTSRKLTLGIATMLAGIVLGTNVNAMDIYQRTFTNKELLLGAPVDSNITTGNSTTTQKTFNKDDWWNTWKAGETVQISMNTLKETPELLCVESEAGLPTSNAVAYKKVVDPVKYGEGTSSYATDYGKREDYKIAYILSEQIRAGQTGELYTQDIQGALWRTRYNFDYTDLDTTNLAGETLYNEATVYAEYKNAYKEPEAVNAGALKTTNQNGTKTVGPFKITYTMKNSGSTMFGDIKEAILQDDNNKQYTHGTDWWFVDANGNEISNTIGSVTYKFPTSGQTFYIKIRSNVNIIRANLSFKFNNINATAESMILGGSYNYPASEGGRLHLCSSCKNAFNSMMESVECGDILEGNTYPGYKLTAVETKKTCKREYDAILNLPEGLTQTKMRVSCGGKNKVTVNIKYYNDGNGKNVTATKNCGDLYTTDYYVKAGTIDVMVDTKTHTALCRASLPATEYNITECTQDGLEGSCTAHQEAYKNFQPCGKVISKNTKISKDGSVVIGNSVCGISRAYPAGTTYTQRLTLAKGERVETTLNFTLSFNVASVDIALRKFITAVNDQAITNRIPQVDTTPLKNGQTTAIYNHTKEVVGVKIGDLVTYTIRVYNEGTEDGYAKEIKDYLPSKLEYVSGTVDGVNYNWQVSTENGKTVIRTTYLANRKLEKFSEATSSGMTYRSELDYADVKVICRVKDGTIANEKLVNLAEVSKYAYYDRSTGTAIDISSDIDSTQNNINLPNDTNWPNYIGAGTSGNYAKGQEDDDDFERVAILYTNVGGTVWLDGVEGKQEERDGILTQNDQRLAGITVRLYKANDTDTVIAETKTDKNGNYMFTKATINGVEQNIPVNDIYAVGFEYGGQQYTPVAVTRLTSGNYSNEKSAGEERTPERNALNDKFHEIVEGTAKNSQGQETVPLTYSKDSNKHTSSIIRDEAFYEASKIRALTEGGFSGTAEYVKYINLGLIERAQLNLGLMTDVQKVDLTINGQTATYDYSQRDEGTAINLEAKAADINRVYNQAIYKSDYNYRIADYNQDGAPVRVDTDKELEVYITYKIKVKNYSSEAAKVSELVNYYTSEYKVVDSWYAKGSETGSVAWRECPDTYGYKTIRTNGIKDINLGANEEVYVYIQYQVTKDENGGVKLGEKYTVTEISGYTTEKGLIDINSEPDNIDISSWEKYVETYEDDTDRAPGLNLTLTDEKREMKGYVWEDSVAGQDSDGVNIGDGIKNGSEENKNGVTVQLIELVTIDGTQYEYIWQEVQTGDKTVSYMDRNGKLHENSKEVVVGTGEYNFTEYVPGKYIVRFKYGDTEKSVALNGQDYKSTMYKGFGENTSSAKDNKDRRLEVMNYSIELTNEKAEALAGNNISELIENTWMYADTVESMTIGIKDKTPGHNVNFGLIKRPISKLAAIKEVNGIKISNKGIIYVDTANGITTGLKEVNGSYYIELDDELINGAQLEVSYKIRIENQGEKDTLYNYFEGDSRYGSNQHAIIRTRAEQVYDYPEKLGFDEGDGWERLTSADTAILNSAVQAKINGGTLGIKAVGDNLVILSKDLAPGESTGEVTITLSKIMAAGGSDDLNYSNKVEIVSRLNEVGRRDEESIPGNYVPQSDVTEPDTGEAEVTISDPTGQDRIYYGLGIVVAVILITGIVLIKKKVLPKR